MDYHIIATLSLVLSGVCAGGSILPAGPLNGAAGGAVQFSTTLKPSARPFISVGWSVGGRNFITYTVTGSDFVDAAYAGRVTLDRTTGSLQLRDLALGDSGDYLVSITPDGEQQKTGTVRLDVYAPVTGVSISNPAPSATLVAGKSTATLTCDAAAGNVSSRQWTKNGRPLLPSPGRVTFSADAKMLSINPVLSDNHGNYQCRVSNPVSAVTAAYDLTVNFGPLNLSIVGPREAALGHRVLLRCSADSVPPPAYRWALDGNDTRVTGAAYVVERMQESDAGNYTCTVNNRVTKLENSTRLYLRASGSAPYWSFPLLLIVSLNVGESLLTC